MRPMRFENGNKYSSIRRLRFQKRIYNIVSAHCSMGRLSNARAGVLHIEKVTLSPDFSVAQILITRANGQALSSSALVKLNARAGMIQTDIAQQLQMRRAPMIHFVTDNNISDTKKVLTLIDSIPN